MNPSENLTSSDAVAHALDLSRAALDLEHACFRVARAPDLNETCAQLLTPLAAAVDATRASLLLINPDTGRLRIAAALGLPANLVGRDVPSRPRSIGEWVVRNQRPLILNGEVKEERFEGSDASVDSAMSMPLEGFEGPVGVINLARTTPAQPFAESELIGIARLLYPVGVAIERVQHALAAERCLHQLGLPDHELVRSLVPEGALEVHHYELGYARVASHRNGGDFCERLPHENGGQSLLLGDASGQGVVAALVACFVRGLFVAHAVPERSAAGIVARLNTELHARLGGKRYAALWVAQLARNGEITYCNAGFSPPLWVPADDSPLRALSTGGPLAGALSRPQFEEERFRLLPGDLVVAASDGVLNARDAAEQCFGADRVGELVTELRRQPLDRLARAVCEAARSFSGRPTPVDDLAVLAFRYNPGG